MSTERSIPGDRGALTEAASSGSRTPGLGADSRHASVDDERGTTSESGRSVTTVAVAALLFLCTTVSVLAIYAASLAVFQFGLPEYYAQFPSTMVSPLLPVVVMSTVVVAHILTLRVARTTIVGWVVPVAAAVVLILEVLVATFVIGFERVEPAGMVPVEPWISARQASNVALVTGLAFVCACTLALVPAARSTRKLRAIAWRACHGVLLTLAAVYSVMPAALAI